MKEQTPIKMSKLDETYNKAKRHYIHFLKYTSPKYEGPVPDNLLELLNSSYLRKMSLKRKIEQR